MTTHAFAALAAEFPNDNAELHGGTIWRVEAVCSSPVAHPPAVATREEAIDAEPEVEDGLLDGGDSRPLDELFAEIEAACAPESVVPEAFEAEDPALEDEPIEIVDSFVFGEPTEIVPAPLESGILGSSAIEEELMAAGILDLSAILEDVLEAGDATDLTIPAWAPSLEESVFVLDEKTRLVSTPPPPIKDPYEAFLQALSDVACEAGHTFAASEIGAMLAGDPVAEAWRPILNGEGDDFSLCATPLDEWAAASLARVLSLPHKAPQFRRDLRAHGVAAFGLIEAA